MTEQIETTVTRHINDYFIGVADLSTIPESLRPEFIIESKDHLKAFVSANEILKNKKLTWIWMQEAPWAAEFRDKIESGTIATLTEAKKEAGLYYKQYSDSYKGGQATKQTGGRFKRTRYPSETEADYRVRLAARKIFCPSRIISFKEQVQDILNLDEQALDHQFEAERDDIENILSDQMSNVDTKSKQAALIALLASKLV